MHISGSVLFCGISDFPERNIHHFGKKDQNDHGQQQQDNQSNIGDIQHAVAGFQYLRHAAVNYHIAFYHVLGGNRGKNADYFMVKIVEKVVYHIVGIPGGGGIKVINDDLLFHVQRYIRVQYQAAGGINDPDSGVQVNGQGVQLAFYRLQIGFAGIEGCGIGVGNAAGFQVEMLRLFPDKTFLRHTWHKGGDNDKAEHTEDEIGQDEFQVKGFIHVLRTSNL